MPRVGDDTGLHADRLGGDGDGDMTGRGRGAACAEPTGGGQKSVAFGDALVALDLEVVGVVSVGGACSLQGCSFAPQAARGGE